MCFEYYFGLSAMHFSIEPLAYSVDALEPHLSARTLDFHYNKHHVGYANKLRDLVSATELSSTSLENIIKKSYGNEKSALIFNNAAQVWNHSFYWKCMKPKGGGRAYSDLLRHIEKDFGSFDAFVDSFRDAAAKQFGSGWAWLVLNNDRKLQVIKTSNAETPLVTDNLLPIITIDVWEHAYYLDFQNRRPDYISVFVNKLVDWGFAQENYEHAMRAFG